MYMWEHTLLAQKCCQNAHENQQYYYEVAGRRKPGQERGPQGTWDCHLLSCTATSSQSAIVFIFPKYVKLERVLSFPLPIVFLLIFSSY